MINLLLNSIKWSGKETTITLIISTEFDKSIKQFYTKFSIEDSALRFCKKEIDKLPVLNPTSLEELIQSTQLKKLKLGLLATTKLLSIIGLTNRIKVVNYDNSKIIKFKILNNVT